MILKKRILFFLLLYGFIRIFSFYFSPDTPLYTANPINSIVSAVILLTTLYLLMAKNVWGWYIIALEMILGGAGGFLAVGPLSLRTSLLITSIPIYFGQKLYERKLIEILQKNRTVTYILA